MSFEDTIRQIIREENEKHLQDIKALLSSHGYQEAPRFLTVKEAAKILRMGTTTAYELCRQAEYNGFPAIREGEGKHYRIPYTALMNWIEQQTKQAI